MFDLKKIVYPAVTALFVVGALSQSSAIAADDRHAGYYYSSEQTSEDYETIVPIMPNASRFLRVGLIVGLNDKQEKRGYAPGYHMFAKGAVAEKLILVSVDTNRYQTIYQLRALLASLTSDARTTKLFQDTGSVEFLNFLDLLKMAGFKQLTISNGKDLTHKINIQ